MESDVPPGEQQKHLGVALLYRTNRKLALTDTGLLFAEDAHHILSDVEEAGQKVGQVRLTPRGLLRVSAPVTPGQWMIAPLIADYLLRYPEMKVALTLTSHKVEPIAEEIDVVIRTGDLEDSRLAARRLGTIDSAFVISVTRYRPYRYLRYAVCKGMPYASRS